MRNRKANLPIAFILTVAMFTPLVALAQSARTSAGDWLTVSSVASGSKLVVQLKDGRRVEGKVNSVSDSSLVLSVKNNTMDLKRDEILSIYQIGKGSATKATLIGLGIGAGTGATIGLVGSSNGEGFDKLDQAVTAGLTVIGAGAGALTGYLIGRRSNKRILIYEAR